LLRDIRGYGTRARRERSCQHRQAQAQSLAEDICGSFSTVAWKWLIERQLVEKYSQH
jgi:hypothetical protein